MSNNDPWQWDEGKIWENILDPNFTIDPMFDHDLFEWWEDKVGISLEEYNIMAIAYLFIQVDYWDNYDLNVLSKERIEFLENILKRPNSHPKQKKVAKILRDRLKSRINDEKYGPAGWMVTGKEIGDGDIDPENL
jgi:hypothetical protein